MTKQVDCEDSQPADFTLTAQGSSGAIDFPEDRDIDKIIPQVPGEYVLSETAAADVLSGYDLVDIECTVDDGTESTTTRPNLEMPSVVVPRGSIAKYTYTNSSGTGTGTLTLEKTMVNDNGGTATASDFQANIDGNDVDWSTAVTVSAGDHIAGESSLAGYSRPRFVAAYFPFVAF